MVHPNLNGYYIKFKSNAYNAFLDLEENDHLKIRKKIECLTSNSSSLNIKKLKSQKINLYRLKVGNFRVIYSIEHEKILIWIIAIGPRKNVYKKINRILNI